jgi:hypothetical protein
MSIEWPVNMDLRSLAMLCLDVLLSRRYAYL